MAETTRAQSAQRVNKTAAAKPAPKKAKPAAQAAAAPKNQKLNYTRGALWALPGVLAGVALWVGIWETGFIASLATFVMAWLTLRLYQKGAGGIDKKSLYVVLPYIVGGIVLSVLAGIVADGLHYALSEIDAFKAAGAFTTLTSADFWDFIFTNLTSATLWQSYAWDIVWAVVLGGFGVYGTVKDLLLPAPVQAEEQKA